MRKLLAIFAGSASVLLIAGAVGAQPAGSPMSSSSGYQQSSQHPWHHSQSSSYQSPGASNDAGTALSHLYQARDELNAMRSGPRRDKALHDIDAAIDETRALSSGPH